MNLEEWKLQQVQEEAGKFKYMKMLLSTGCSLAFKRLPVDIFSMSDFVDKDSFFKVIDYINDTIGNNI